jgi:hypothetical protein
MNRGLPSRPVPDGRMAELAVIQRPLAAVPAGQGGALAQWGAGDRHVGPAEVRKPAGRGLGRPHAVAAQGRHGWPTRRCSSVPADGSCAAVRWIPVTGASGGIGRATTARLADAGHVVFAAARRAGALKALDVTDSAASTTPATRSPTRPAGTGLTC